MNIFYVIIGVLGLGTFIFSLINLIKCIKNLKKATKNQFTITPSTYATIIHRTVLKNYRDAIKMYIINIILSFIPIGLLVSHVIGLI